MTSEKTKTLIHRNLKKILIMECDRTILSVKRDAVHHLEDKVKRRPTVAHVTSNGSKGH